MAEDTLRTDSGESKDPVVQGAATSAASDAPDTPAPKKRASRRKTASPEDAPPAEAAPKGATPDAAAPDAAEEKPKRRAPRRKKVDDPEAVAEAPPAAEASAEEAPKPRRRSRKAAEASAESAPSEAKAAEASTPEPVSTETSGPPRVEGSAEGATPAEGEERPRRRRSRKAAEAEPVASSDSPTLETSPEASDRPDEGASQAPRVPTLDWTQDKGSRADAPPPREASPPREDRPSPRGEGPNSRDERPAYDDEERGGRRSRRNRRKKDREGQGQQQGQGQQHGQGQGQPQGQGQQQHGQGQQGQGQKQQGQGGNGHPNASPGQPFEGILELIGDKKFGFIRAFHPSLLKGDNDAFMPPPLIAKYGLRDGVHLTGYIKPGRKGAWQVVQVDTVMGAPPEDWEHTPDFDDGLVIYPEEKLTLPIDATDVSMRVVDLVAPLGKGQRALIVAPPRAGKTIILKQIAAGLTKNHPEVKLVALLIDERPEEVTDFRRNTDATVFASSNDHGEDNHVRVATLSFEYSRRLVEQGHDVVILIDSLTRLGRTFNLWGGNSGRTMSGGLDARALLMPRKIFGSARNIEGGGSLTIIATALIETGSRMDEVIFEEFKGTGNSEIVLDRELSEKRIYPAINIRKSGTRNEERLVPEEHLRKRHLLLRALNSRHPVEAMQALGKQIHLTASNADLLNGLIPEGAA